MSIFKRKPVEKLNSEEYLELAKEIQGLKIKLETLRLDVDLYKRKLRLVKKLDHPSGENEVKGNINKVLLPEK